jgi:hypothetical protein
MGGTDASSIDPPRIMIYPRQENVTVFAVGLARQIRSRPMGGLATGQ